MTGFPCPNCGIGKPDNLPLVTKEETIWRTDTEWLKKSVLTCCHCSMSFEIRELDKKKTKNDAFSSYEVTFKFLGKERAKSLRKELETLEDRKREIQYEIQQLE